MKLLLGLVLGVILGCLCLIGLGALAILDLLLPVLELMFCILIPLAMLSWVCTKKGSK